MHFDPRERLDEILKARACGAEVCPCAAAVQEGGGRTHCPAHADDIASMKVSVKRGRVLLHCYSGCTPDAVVRKLSAQGLWETAPNEHENGLTLAALARSLGLNLGFLLSLDVRDGVWGTERRGCVDIPFFDEAGEQVALRKRLRLIGNGRFIWRRGDHAAPYGLERLAQARDAAQILLVEHESDAWACWAAGLPALGIPGASSWSAASADYLDGIAERAVWKKPDGGSDDLAARVALTLPDVAVVEAPADAPSPTELWLAFGGNAALFRERIQELIAAAPSAATLRDEENRREAREALSIALPLLEAPDLLERVASAVRDAGYAGDTTPAVLAYLALTSRVLERPMNLAFVAPSAAGKNRAVDAARALMPKSAYHLERAGSPRALIYSDESFKHRTVIICEADSIPEDSSAGSAVRSLASENEMAYDVVESIAGVHVVRTIVKPGPTGLITTSTRPLPHQMDTRVLTIGITDTPEQTRRVLLAEAAAVNGPRETAAVTGFVALQRWIELEGERRVRIPFAERLAGEIPTEQVRMRRDFRQLLTMIQAIALLHQLQRSRDADGCVVATLEDYALARELLLPVFTEAATAGVSDAVRETVQAVADLLAKAKKSGTKPSVTKTDVARRLGLPKDTVWRRIERCIELRYLANLSGRKSLPARLALGDPLPDDRRALPEVADLAGTI